jgi:hypothetical protein
MPPAIRIRVKQYLPNLSGVITPLVAQLRGSMLTGDALTAVFAKGCILVTFHMCTDSVQYAYYYFYVNMYRVCTRARTGAVRRW